MVISCFLFVLSPLPPNSDSQVFKTALSEMNKREEKFYETRKHKPIAKCSLAWAQHPVSVLVKDFFHKDAVPNVIQKEKSPFFS